MSYRDDRDALLARNTALERENEALRRELAKRTEPRDPPPPPRRRARRIVGALGRGLRSCGRALATSARGLAGIGRGLGWLRAAIARRVVVVMVAIPAMVIAGMVALSRCDTIHRITRGEPYLSRVMVASGGDGEVIAVLAGYSGKRSSSHELSTFDARTGTRLGTLELERRGAWNSGEVSLFRPVEGRVWARYSDGKLALLDLSGPSVALSREALASRVPELAAGYRIVHETINDYSPPTPGVHVTLHDGRTGWIDMTPAFRTSRPRTSPWPPGYFCGPDDGAKPSCERTECLGFAALPGTSAYALSSVPTWPDGQRHRAAPIAGGASPLLRPGLVERLETECAFEVDDSVLVIHDSAAMEPKETLFSLVDRASGKLRWTRRIAELTERTQASALGARVVDGEILLLLHQRRRSLDLVRLSLAGEVLARHRLL